MTEAQEIFIVGSSEDCEAEYSFRADAPFTILSMYQNEVYCAEGFKTLEAAKADLKANEIKSSQIIYL